MLLFSSCNPNFLQLHIHYPVNPSSDHLHTEAVVPSSDHCCTETVLPSSDHYCIGAVAPSGDHCFTETLAPSTRCIDIAELPSSS